MLTSVCSLLQHKCIIDKDYIIFWITNWNTSSHLFWVWSIFGFRCCVLFRSWCVEVLSVPRLKWKDARSSWAHPVDVCLYLPPRWVSLVVPVYKEMGDLQGLIIAQAATLTHRRSLHWNNRLASLVFSLQKAVNLLVSFLHYNSTSLRTYINIISPCSYLCQCRLSYKVYISAIDTKMLI